MAALRADAPALTTLRAEHASLEAAAAEAGRVAALNSELRLILAGSEGVAEEHQRLAAAVEEADALRAEVEDMRAALQGAEDVLVRGAGQSCGSVVHGGTCLTCAPACKSTGQRAILVCAQHACPWGDASPSTLPLVPQAGHEELRQQVKELETLRAENADMAALVTQLRVMWRRGAAGAAGAAGACGAAPQLCAGQAPGACRALLPLLPVGPPC